MFGNSYEFAELFFLFPFEVFVSSSKKKPIEPSCTVERGGGGGRNPGVMGERSIRQSGEEKRGRETGYPRGIGRGQESGAIGNEFCNIAQYFAIEKAHGGGNH